MQDDTLSIVSAPTASYRAGITFFAALALATMLPLAMLPLSGIETSADVHSALLGLWVVTGLGHVMSTTWFSLDKDYEAIIDAHRLRMIASLAALPLAMAVIVLTLPEVGNWAFAIYGVWLAHHYNRQNFGIMALAAAHDGTGPLPKEIGWVLHLTTCAGAIIVVTMPAIYADGATTPALIRMVDLVLCRSIAAALLVAGGALAIHLAATRHSLRSSPTVLIFLLLSVAFFIPGLAATSPITAFWPYAMAHGAQYLIIMGVNAQRSPRGLMGLVIFISIAYALGIVAYAMIGVPWAAFYTGIVMWHFLADARLWRLRDPAVRAIVRNRFDFVFRPH